MLALDLIPGRRWLHCRQLDEPYEYEPRSNCHEPITALFSTIGLATAEVGAGAALGAGALGAAEVGAGALATGGFGYGAAAAAGGSAAASTGLFGTGIGLSEIGTVASLGGSVLEASAKSEQAAYQAAVERANAVALRQKANDEAGAGQRKAITNLRQAELVGSRARALAANSGTLATDPTQVNIEAGIAGQGEYNALSALYEGMSAARSSNYQAEIDLFKSKRIETAAPWAMGGTILSGIGSLADRKTTRGLFDRYGKI